MIKVIGLLTTTTLFSISCWSQTNDHSEGTYQFEGGFIASPSSDTSSTTVTQYGLGGSIYLKPVELYTDEPDFEHEFIQRSSNISFTVKSYKSDSPNTLTNTAPEYYGSGTLYFNDLVLGLGYDKVTYKLYSRQNSDNGYTISADQSRYSLGYFWLPESLISIRILLVTATAASYQRFTKSLKQQH